MTNAELVTMCLRWRLCTVALPPRQSRWKWQTPLRRLSEEIGLVLNPRYFDLIAHNAESSVNLFWIILVLFAKKSGFSSGRVFIFYFYAILVPRIASTVPEFRFFEIINISLIYVGFFLLLCFISCVSVGKSGMHFSCKLHISQDFPFFTTRGDTRPCLPIKK